VKGYGYEPKRPVLGAIVALAALALIVFVLLQGIKMIMSAASAQGYLPPERYRQAQPAEQPHNTPRTQREAPEPMEYYAEDWIVLDTKGRTVCKDPYIRKDVKIVQCVSDEKVR
jgi:hypothetical protein